MRFFSCLYISGVLLVLAAGCRSRHDTHVEVVRHTSQARQHIGAQDWQAAKGALFLPDSVKLGRAQQEEVTFTRGYYYHTRAAAEDDSTQRQVYVDSALYYYQQVLARNPNNTALNQNMALLCQLMDKPARAILFLKKALRRNESAEYLMMLGDLYMQAARYDSTIYYYNLAVEKQPSLELAHRRLVNLYAFYTPGEARVLAHCRQMIDAGFAELSSRALADLVNRAYLSPDSVAAQQAFVWWMSLYGRNQTDQADVPSVFPIRWRFPAFQEVDAVWKNSSAVEALRWWRSDRLYGVGQRSIVPRVVISEALDVLGSSLLHTDKRSAEGVFVLEKAYDVLTKGDAYTLLSKPSTIPDVFFDLSANLGMAYVQYPQLSSSRFDRLEGELFGGKGEAIELKNTEAAMKFHTTLGLIYATKGQWGSVYDPRGAIFQLWNAIRKAPAGKNTTPLKELLTKGYLQIGMKDSARSMSLSMAMSYLNDDNLLMADSSLARYRALEGISEWPDTYYYYATAGEPPSGAKVKEYRQYTYYKSLLALVALRNRIATASPLDTAKARSLVRQANSLLSPTGRFSQFFCVIQRFKMLADLGTCAAGDSDTILTTFFHSLALTDAEHINSLCNLRDVTRMNDIQATLQQAVAFPTARVKLVPQDKQGVVKSDQAKVKVWDLQGPYWSPAQEVQMDQRIFLAAQVATVVSRNDIGKKRPSEVFINELGNDVLVIASDSSNVLKLRKGVKRSLPQAKVTVNARR
jgi:tetratricopeptide (TPR) repeat protein